MDKRKNNGGHKAGRQKSEDKAVPVQVYIKASRIKELGGIEKAREIAKKVLQ